MSLLYDRYYDRAETLDAVTELEIVEEPTPEPCEDGTQPPCESNDDTTGTNDDTTGTNDDTTDTTTEPDTNQNNDDVGTPVDTSQAEEDNVEDQALLLFFALIAVMLTVLYFVSRGGEDALAAEVQIEKMWDEQEAETASSAAFVPAPPPMAPPGDENE